MTVNQLFREFQKLKLDGYGEFTVMITDFTDEPPVPEPIGSVKVLKNGRKVFIQSITAQQLVEGLSKSKQKVAKGSNC